MINKMVSIFLLSFSSALFTMEEDQIILPHLLTSVPPEINEHTLNYLFENNLEETTKNFRSLTLINRNSYHSINDEIESLILRISKYHNTVPFLTALYLGTYDAREYALNISKNANLTREEVHLFHDVVHKKALQQPITPRMSRIAGICLGDFYRRSFVDCNDIIFQNEFTFLKNGLFAKVVGVSKAEEAGYSTTTEITFFNPNGKKIDTKKNTFNRLTHVSIGSPDQRIITKEKQNRMNEIVSLGSMPINFAVIGNIIEKYKSDNTLDNTFGNNGVLDIKNYTNDDDNDVIDIFEDDSVLCKTSSGMKHLIKNNGESNAYGDNYIGEPYKLINKLINYVETHPMVIDPSAIFKDSSGTIRKSTLFTVHPHLAGLSKTEQEQYDYILIQEKYTPEGTIQEIYKCPKATPENESDDSQDEL